MGNPYTYPKTKHTRTQTPPSYNSYKKYKPFLQKEFNGQCVYCRSSDIKGYETFGVDHYRPQKNFPHLANEYMNLYYACNRCNSLKRNYWPDTSQEKRGLYIPNPCDHVMLSHLRYKKGEVVYLSKAGQFSIERMDLNDPRVIKYREGVIGAIELAEQQQINYQLLKLDILERLKEAINQQEIDDLKAELESVENKLKSLTELIKNLGG